MSNLDRLHEILDRHNIPREEITGGLDPKDETGINALLWFAERINPNVK